MELVFEGGVFLGWKLPDLCDLGLFSPSRTQGEHSAIWSLATLTMALTIDIFCLQGRTYAELDLLFEHGVPARKFATTNIDPYSESVVPVKRLSTGTDEVTMAAEKY